MSIRNASRKYYDQWEILNSKVEMLNEFGSNTKGYYGAIPASSITAECDDWYHFQFVFDTMKISLSWCSGSSRKKKILFCHEMFSSM